MYLVIDIGFNCMIHWNVCACSGNILWSIVAIEGEFINVIIDVIYSFRSNNYNAMGMQILSSELLMSINSRLELLHKALLFISVG